MSGLVSDLVLHSIMENGNSPGMAVKTNFFPQLVNRHCMDLICQMVVEDILPGPILFNRPIKTLLPWQKMPSQNLITITCRETCF